MSQNILGSIHIKSSCVTLLKENLERIAVLFSATLNEKATQEYEDLIYFDLSAPTTLDRSPDFLNRVQVIIIYFVCVLLFLNLYIN